MWQLDLRRTKQSNIEQRASHEQEEIQKDLGITKTPTRKTKTNKVSPSGWRYQNSSAQTEKKKKSMENQTEKRINLKLLEQEIIESRQCQEEMDTNQLVPATDKEEIYQKTTTQGTMTEDRHNPLYGTKTEQGTGLPIYCHAIRKGQKLRPIMHFVKERDWESVKRLYVACF